MRKASIGSLVLLFAANVPHSLFGQQQSERADKVQARNDCRLAVQVLVHGQPANKRDWALTVIDDCGPEGADAIAHALREERRASTRSPGLDDLATAATSIVDAEVFRAALEIAGDVTAGEAARVHAIGILNTQITRRVLPYEALITDPYAGRVVMGNVTTWQPLVVRELPPDARSTTAEVLSHLLDESPCGSICLAARRVFYRIQTE